MGRQADPRPARWVVGGAFGTAEARWRADAADDAAEVAAAWLQHRLLRRIAEHMGTAEVAAAELARRIGRPERSTYRAVRGERLVPLDELIGWAAAVGLELFDDFPDSVTGLLPPGVPALAADWHPGGAEPMHFARRTRITDVPWPAVGIELAAWLDGIQAGGTADFVDPAVLLHAVVAEILRHGVPPGVAHPGRHLGAHTEAWFDDPHTTVLVAAVDLGESRDREAALTATRRVVDAAFEAGHHDADTRLVCLALSRRAHERLEGHVERAHGGHVLLPFDRLRGLPGGDDLRATLNGDVLCEAQAGDGFVVVWSVEKPDRVL